MKFSITDLRQGNEFIDLVAPKQQHSARHTAEKELLLGLYSQQEENVPRLCPGTLEARNVAWAETSSVEQQQ